MSTEAPEPKRLPFVDTLRGLGVVFMIQLHTSHGWLSPAVRNGTVWNAAQFFGGLAAPIFLMLAGMSLGIQWGRAAERGRPLEHRRNLARGLQLVVLGYALRLQMWVIDAGGYSRPGNYLAIACLLAAYALAYAAAEHIEHTPRRAATWGAGAALLWCAGALVVRIYEPERMRNLVRVDVLQCIGASLALLNVFAARTAPRAPSIRGLLLLTAAVGLATPWLRAVVPGPLPEAIAGYLGQWPAPDGKLVLSLFPLFPWLGFATTGAALGLSWMRARTLQALDIRVIGVIALGAWLALLTSEAWLPMHLLARDHDALAALVRLAYKSGLVMVMIGVAVALARTPAWLRGPLQTLGSSSLLVYWVHLEFAFGVAARPLVRHLGLVAWAAGTAVLIVAMWLVAVLRRSAATGQWRWPRRRVVPG